MGVCLQSLTGKAGHGLHWCCGGRTVRESAPATENRDWTILLTTKHLNERQTEAASLSDVVWRTSVHLFG